MAERSNAAVLKTVEVRASGGSNPSLRAKKQGMRFFHSLFLYRNDRAEMRGRKQPPAMRGGEKL